MTTHHYILATAGHVDHGKSALVKALTGTDPDRLPEEKARGITIDLGFAHLEMAAPTAGGGSDLGNNGAVLSIGIVDVPGHEDFVKNMVAGVGSIDLALIIVAADDGWMPQTEEHLQILAYLGVSRAVVALTKIDLLESERERSEAVSQVKEKLQGSPFEDAPIVPVSAMKGTGIEALKAALKANLQSMTPSADVGKPRLPVDRVFILKGIGTVVTGTLSGGTLQRGQAVVIQPGGHATRVRTLHAYNREVECSRPGMRTAVNLPDVDKASHAETQGVRRGDVVTIQGLGSPSATLDVLVRKSARLLDAKHGAARPLKDGTIVQVHHGSGHVTARLFLGGQPPVEPGQELLAQLRCETPLFALAGDRFILRDWSEQWTLGGGIILDPEADRKRFKTEGQRTFLQQRAQSPQDVRVFALSELEREGAVLRSRWLCRTRFGAEEAERTMASIISEQKALVVGDWVASAAWWRSLRSRAVQAIENEHKARPHLMGLGLRELRSAVEKDLPAPDLFDALVRGLGQNGFVQSGTMIRKAVHKPALPSHLQAAGQRVRAALSAKPFEPPSRKELAPDQVSQQALRFLLDTGEAVDVGPGIVLLTEASSRATEIVKQLLRSRGKATVSEIRQAVGASRRIIVPLLERLDKEGVTRREGDYRVLRMPK